MVQDLLIAAAVVVLGSAAVVVFGRSWVRALGRALARQHIVRPALIFITGLAFGAFILTSAALPYTEVMASTAVPPLLYLAVALALFAAGIVAGRAVLRRRRAPRRAEQAAAQPTR